MVSPIAERKDPITKQGAKQLPPNGLVVRCLVFKNKHGEYSAECIDLDLLVYGKTAHEALDSLRDAIMGYIAVAFSGDLSGLIPRPSPFSHRVRYHWFALRAALNIGFNVANRKFLLSDWSPRSSFC